MQYRQYADGRLVHEDDWTEEDNSLPYYDDYRIIDDIPDDLDEDEVYAFIDIMDKLEQQFS